MIFSYSRTVHLSDTDAAGVLYFANLLVICHEAYEESLLTVGINFNQLVRDTELAIPIVHSSANYFLPIRCGDKLSIQLQPQQLSDNEFEINYQIFNSSSEKLLAKATTKHVCIATGSRKRMSVPTSMIEWLYNFASSEYNN